MSADPRRAASPSGTGGTALTPMGVMVEVQNAQETDPHTKGERHRQMARAAIRVALRHGIPSDEIMAEYEDIQEVERDAR